jgi:acetyltransferase-like isoleucine patch superfamily enzyme
LVIGRNSSIGNDAILDARGSITIGDNVNLSTGVHIWTGQHDWASAEFRYVKAPVTIGDRVWLSDRTTILPGVTIGEAAVLAAGAVASKDVGAFDLAGGVPAKRIGKRPEDLTYDLPPARKKLWWW